MFRTLALLIALASLYPMDAEARRGRAPMTTIIGTAFPHREAFASEFAPKCSARMETISGDIKYLLWNPTLSKHEHTHYGGYVYTHTCSQSQTMVRFQTVSGEWVQGTLHAFNADSGLVYVRVGNEVMGFAGWNPESSTFHMASR